MDALGSPHLSGRSRYPHPPLSHHQFVDPDYYHRQFHYPDSFPPPLPPLPPYGNQPSPPRRHERDLRVPADDGGGGRLYFRYPQPQYPFPQPPPRVPEQFPLPDDRYPSPRPHPLGHGEGFIQERREGRVVDADRFKVVDGNQDLIRLRWEEEERRRMVASCRGSYYVEDLEGELVRRKRMRWAQETDPLENFGGLGQRHLHVWDRVVDHRRYGFSELLPGSSLGPAYASSPGGTRNFVVPEGNRESASVGEWRQLPPPISSYFDRDKDRKGEIGCVMERHLRPPVLTVRPSGHSYSDMHGEFLENDAPITGHGFQEDCFRGNRGKRKILSNGKDYNLRWSPIKQPAKRPSALSRIQSGVSVWNRIQEKPSFISSRPASFSPPNNYGKLQEVSTPKSSFRSNNLVGEALATSSPTFLSSDGKDPERATTKRTGKRKLVRKWEEVSQITSPDSLFSEVKSEIPNKSTTDPPQKVSIDSQILDNHRSTDDFNSQNCLVEVSGTVLVDTEIAERTSDQVRFIEDEHNNRNIENLATVVSNLTELAATKATEKSVPEDVSMIVNSSEAAGDDDDKEKQLVKLGENDVQNCTEPLVHFVAQSDASSRPFTQINHQVSLDAGTVQLPSVCFPVDNAIEEDHVKQDICGLGDGYKSTYVDNGIAPSFCEYSSSQPLTSTEQIIMLVDCKSLTSSSDVTLDKNMKWKRHSDGNEHLEVDLAAKQLKEIGRENSTMSDVYLNSEIQSLPANLPSQLSDTNSDRCLPDGTTDEKDGLSSHSGAESPQSDSLRPVEESSTVASIFISGIQEAPICVVSEQPCQGLHNSYGCIDDDGKQDQRISRNSLLTLKEPLVLGAGCSRSTKDTGIKPILEKEKSLSSDYLVKQELVESKAINRLEHLVRKTVPSSGLPIVIPSQANLLSSAKESARKRHSMRSKTWHRKDAFSTSLVALQSKKCGSFYKSPKKPGKLQSSYVRKGNSLIRKPPTEPPQLLNAIGGTSSKLSNDVAKKNMNLESKTSTKVNLSCLSLPSFERPKTPPLPLAIKLLNCTNPSLEAPCSISDNSIPEAKTDVQGNPLDSAPAAVTDLNVARERIPEPWCAKRMIYVKHKSNQLVAAHGPKSCDSANPLEKKQALASSASSDLYYRKKKNQLIRSIFSSCGQDKQDLVAGHTISDVSRKPTPLRKRLDKAQEKVYKNSTSKHVWTLNGKEPHKKCVSSVPRLKVLPYLIPWKRTMYWTNKSSVLRRRFLLLHSGKSQLIRKKDVLYRLSTDGFSLQKAGASHAGRSCLKWSRSMQRRSKIVNKEAALAVAEVERKRRERTQFASAADHGNKGNSVFYEHSCANQEVRNTLASRKFSGGNNEYIRIGNGNQLVRDPKKLIRILASEKVRWSLHNARLRLAKKRQYCLFFSRFGKCNKKGGKCPYIHDPSKVAICTKFLSGSCSNTSCKLTHKIVRERMPDCSYFLQGLCTNTSCPYRHVNLNPNASVCEGFLKGYCADGDECRKQHSFVCLAYKSTGKCLQGSKCKLHHPKIKKKCKERKDFVTQSNSWGRYFGSSVILAGEPLVPSSDNDAKKAEDLFCSDGRFTDFVSLSPDSSDGEGSAIVLMALHESHIESLDSVLHKDDLDALIKPVRIMRQDYSTQPPAADSS